MENTYRLKAEEAKQLFDDNTWGAITSHANKFILRDPADTSKEEMLVNVYDDVTVINDVHNDRKFILNLKRNSVLTLDTTQEELINGILDNFVIPLRGSKADLYAFDLNTFIEEAKVIVSSGISDNTLSLISEVQKDIATVITPLNASAKYKAYVALVKSEAKELGLTDVKPDELQTVALLGRSYSQEAKRIATCLVHLVDLLKDRGLTKELMDND